MGKHREEISVWIFWLGLVYYFCLSIAVAGVIYGLFFK